METVGSALACIARPEVADKLVYAPAWLLGSLGGASAAAFLGAALVLRGKTVGVLLAAWVVSMGLFCGLDGAINSRFMNDAMLASALEREVGPRWPYALLAVGAPVLTTGLGLRLRGSMRRAPERSCGRS